MKMEKSGGRPKKETIGFDKPKTTGFENNKTNGYVKEETETKPNVNDNVNVNANDNVNENASALYDADVEKMNNAFVETLGSTNLNNIRECIGYLDKLPFKVIEYALRKTARKGAKWDYAITILNDYVEKNLNTLEKVQANEIEFKNKNNNQATKQTDKKLEQREYNEDDFSKLYANGGTKWILKKS